MAPQVRPEAQASATATLAQSSVTNFSTTNLEAVLQSGSFSFITQFGGQGSAYWDELKFLYNTSNSATARKLIALAADALRSESSSNEARTPSAFERELNLSEWLETDDESLACIDWERAIFSYPLIALTQMANYVAFLDLSSISHTSVVQHTSASIGHSQGVVSAAVFAAARSTEEFIDLAVRTIRYMFWHGLRAQETFLKLTSDSPKAAKHVDGATPMLLVQGLSKAQIEDAIESVNCRNEEHRMQISLVNARDMFCVTGLPSTLVQLKKKLESLLAPAGIDQTRIRHSERKPVGSISFVSLSCPFHSVMLSDAKLKILADVKRIHFALCGHQLQVPVYATTSEATNLKALGETSIIDPIVDMQLTQVTNWTATWATLAQYHHSVTHVLDFGPALGAAKLSTTPAEALGIKIVLGGPMHDELHETITSSPFQRPTEFLGIIESHVTTTQSWEARFGPRIDANGTLVNKFTRLLKRPPVIVSGMTPTTSLNGTDLVAAIQNAGFYGELAAGGLSRPNIFEDTVLKLASKIKPGVGIAINMLYLNVKQWGFQFPKVLSMRRNGVPIESITIGAGIPTMERAMELIGELQAVGIDLIAFKPGSVDAIYSALEIAKSAPTMKVMIQWTGGRAGGHHSFEDFHEPLEQTYAEIRRVENVILVVGSGFGNWEDSHTYLTGEWSLARGHIFKMPVDAILLGSRVMAAKEAATAPEVKQLLVDTPGIGRDDDWEQAYEGVVGGISTVSSEFGEPIHGVANRCGLLWKEFDDKYFSLPRDQVELALRRDKDSIITRLNADSHRPYFGQRMDLTSGEIIFTDLEEMTYAEVLQRMVDLMFVNVENRPRRWLHESFRERVAKFLIRTQERFYRGELDATFEHAGLADEPGAVLVEFIKKYPQASTTLISVEDRDFFVNLSRLGGKPVNFIPVIDADFKAWFKRDSLWYSEDLDAVLNRDPQRVCILQGPMAVKYITKVDEPVAEILAGIANGFIKVASEINERTISPEVQHPAPTSIAGIAVRTVAADGLQVVVPYDISLLEEDAWVNGLSTLTTSSWLASVISSKNVVDNGKWVANPVRALLRPQKHQTVVVDSNGLRVFDSSLALTEPVVNIHRGEEKNVIQVSVRELRPATSELCESEVSLTLSFRYYPERTIPIIAESDDALVNKIKNFYARFWVAKNGDENASCAEACDTSVLSTFSGEFVVSASDITAYNESIGLDDSIAGAPVDFSTIIAWRPLIQSVFAKEVRGNLFDLVHLKHGYKLLATDDVAASESSKRIFFPGDKLAITSTVSSLRIVESGKVVSAMALISRTTTSEKEEDEFKPLVELRSEFLIRGVFSDFESTFSTKQSTHRFTVSSASDLRALETKSWLKLSAEITISDKLEFRVATKKHFVTPTRLKSIEVSGELVVKGPESDLQVATVEFTSNTATESPVNVYLRHIGHGPKDKTSAGKFASGGYNMLETPLVVSVPESALPYAVASRDLNPIHRSAYAAILAKLPNGKPIMHGLWTATKVRALVVETLGGGQDSNIVAFDVEFNGMIFPGESLFMQLRHIGLNEGCKMVDVEVVNAEGERVVTARAHINEPPTAFVFTGQGSAAVGMGMERYMESLIARDVWDRGDAHLRKMFGFSILQIVRQNPTSITVHFRGKKGRAIRANYMQLTYEDPATGVVGPQFPEINMGTTSYMFSAPDGLLFATQFSQPALVLLEKAYFAEIQVAQLSTNGSIFAGHSLGEYAGLTSFAEVLEIEDAVEIVFIRGLIMQRAVERDSTGRSNYGMVAANPQRVGDYFTAQDLLMVVDTIQALSGKLLQVVNFNVQDQQYVVAGEVGNLEVLALALSKVRKDGQKALLFIKTTIASLIDRAIGHKEQCKKEGKSFVLTRGVATTPLPGIDVPFHSQMLTGGVTTFRTILQAKFKAEVLERQLPLMVGRYIPNLTAEPFSLDREYFQRVYDLTRSPCIAEVLTSKQWGLRTRAELAHVLQVELLAYQFASPVQWIKTQELIFRHQVTGVRRFIEIGPAPTLTNMAKRSLKSGDFPDTQREILWYQRDREAVHYEVESINPSASDYARGQLAPTQADRVLPELSANQPTVEQEQISVPQSNTSIVQASSTSPQVAAAAPVSDAPVAAMHVLRVLLSVRLNKALVDVKEDSDVKTLSGGKSAVQNEIVGDLETEFGAGFPEGAAELPLHDIASKLSSYRSLGKVSSSLISKMVSSKMPGGFNMSSIKAYLSGPKALGPGRTESALLHSLTMAPSIRFKREDDARKWLDDSVDSYASFACVSLPSTVIASPQPMPNSTASAPTPISNVENAPLSAKHALLVLLAAKFDKPLSEVVETTSIKALAAGKSAVQNEIVGDVEKEFGSAPGDAAEMKLSELQSKWANYNSPGKVTSTMIAKLLASKMPGGFGVSAVKDHLAIERCLPAGRIDSVLLHTLSLNPKQRFSSDLQAKEWLDGVVDDYAKFCGITIPHQSKLGGAAVMTVGASRHVGASVVSSLPNDFEKRLKTMIADQVDALNEFLTEDRLDWHRSIETEVELREHLERSVGQIVAEHGEVYVDGIRSVFDPKKEREYASYWNWVIRDAVEMFKALDADHMRTLSDWLDNVQATSSTAPPAAVRHLLNRATPELLQCVKYFAGSARLNDNIDHAHYMKLFVEQVTASLNTSPISTPEFQPTKPLLTIRVDGKLEYAEVPRQGVISTVDYVHELARELEFNDSTEIEENCVSDAESTINHDGSTTEDEDEDTDDSNSDKNDITDITATDARTMSAGYNSKTKALSTSGSALRSGLDNSLKQIVLPFVYIRKLSEVDPTIRLYDVESTRELLCCMREMASGGISFDGKVALITGCGRNSIGAEVVKALLEGGATVFVTTSSFSHATTMSFREMYEVHGSRGSRLFVVPFNQASKVDVEQLVAHIYETHKLDLDFVVPFASLSEAGRTITTIDSHSELAHRVMLTNTIRLLGEIVASKKARGLSTSPALVVLPMSSNHGNFGGDGLYGESKLGVESLMSKWSSENWEDQLSLVGAIIGWTRSTGLMSGNNDVSEGMEKLGLRTFSTAEMGFNLAALFHPTIVDRAADEPIWADLSGGMTLIREMGRTIETIRREITKESQIRASVFAASQLENTSTSAPSSIMAMTPRPNMSGFYSSSFPDLSAAQKLAELTANRGSDKLPHELLRGMIDLRQVVVVAGFGEIGPWGSSRTRWEMESYGHFSLEGCIELAWLTGHIQYVNDSWVDAKTMEVIADHEIKAKYEAAILAHTGIRVIEPELFDGYDPHHKTVLHQVAIDKKMAPIEVADQEEAMEFRREIGADNVDVFQNADTGTWMIRLRKGAVLNIPRALAFDRFVAGQIPTGWSAERLGIPKDLAESVDPITLYALASTMEAFVAAGVTDPYEFYQYVHVSQVGNASGGGVGGTRGLQRMFRDRFIGKSVPSDTLQECFINVAPAWVNMLLLSSSGPIKTPVGTCATAAESVEIGVETIKSGKARIVVTGGYDDFSEEVAYEFAQMKATSDSVKEVSMGRDTKEMCRPCTTTRGGFMESHGAGMQLLMDAQLALDMGVPIYGIVALTNTATDKNGRSVPAPGQGILTTARESHTSSSDPSPMLDIAFRRRQFDAEVAWIEAWFEREKALLPSPKSAEQKAMAIVHIEKIKARKLKAAQAMWSTEFFADRDDIAPIRGALSVWNLSINDVGVASFHGTGTKANDRNESEVTHQQMQHLGRSKGNPLPVICQKHLTGHPKGPAAAWMLNGLLQVLNSGLIPGNRNLDSADPELRQFDHLVYPNRSLQTAGIKAALLKSFGFGQAGGEVLLVHADCLLSTLTPEEFAGYAARRERRRSRMNTYAQGALLGKHAYIQVKASAPYSAAQQRRVYLDPTARASFDVQLDSWRFQDAVPASSSPPQPLESPPARRPSPAAAPSESSEVLKVLERAAGPGVGVDVEPVATFERLEGRECFLARNFSAAELALSRASPDAPASLAGRWAAKEAVLKALASAAPHVERPWAGAGAPLRSVEVLPEPSGAPGVRLSGLPLRVFQAARLQAVSVSISHAGGLAVAQAVASFQQEP